MALDLAVTRGEVLGDSPKPGGRGVGRKGPRSVLGKRDALEVSYREKGHLHLTHTPKDCALGLPREETGAKEGGASFPLSIAPKSKEIAVGCSFESIQVSCHGSP